MPLPEPTEPSAHERALLAKIESRAARVAVIGLGYVGLSLAAALAEAGLSVEGIDVSEERAQGVSRGRSHVEDIADARLAPLVAAGRLRASTSFDALAAVDAVVICVPTPLRKTRDPDLTHVVEAARATVERLRPGALVVLESTSYPGTTDEVLAAPLEARGLLPGRDAFVAFSPERIDPGNRAFDLRNTPKVVGGASAACARAAAALYRLVSDEVVAVGSTRAAEMVKLLENTFRAVNIGLVNELAVHCDRLGVDVWEVVRAAATKPFGFMPFTPGPGLGGHCIPVDPLYLSWKLRERKVAARFIELADEVNAGMPAFVVQKAARALNSVRKAVNGTRVLVTGVAYKRDVKDVRESPALDVIEGLERLGAEVRYHDPHVPSVEVEGAPRRSEPALSLEGYDLVVIVTDHAAIDHARIAREAALVLDCRGATRAAVEASPGLAEKVWRL